MSSLFRIRFITESDFISDAIRAVTFSQWSHVEIITETGSYIGARASGGVQERPANYTAVSQERRYSIKVGDDQLARIMEFARSKIGTSYSFVDIAGIFIHHNLGAAEREICSMFVVEAALAGGVAMLNVLPGYTNLITPEMLHLSPLLIGTCDYSVPPLQDNLD